MRTCLYILILLASAQMACTSHKPRLENDRVTMDRPVIKNLNEASGELKKLQLSLVRLRISDTQKKEESYGTGFFYRTRDLLVTSQHLFNQGHPCLQQLQCTLHAGLAKNSQDVQEQSIDVEVILKHPTKDLIFLKIKDASQFSHVQPLQNPAKNTQGVLTAAGFYQDKPALTFSQGRRIETAQNTSPLTSIIVSAGFSGSPVINSQGELVGVVSSFKPLQGQHIGLAQYTTMDGFDF